MAKLVTIKAPAMEKGKVVTLDVQGYVALLYVGTRQEKFLLQLDHADGKPAHLTHYASGMKVGNLNAVKALHHISYQRMTDREAAKRLLHSLVVKHGTDKVLARMQAAAVLNT